ncbi:MAG: hypothetical protein ACK449_08075 [Planctomycetota bacterium]|jgi:hypothetical protein
MSEEIKQLDLANLSEKLHLFICPLFTEPKKKVRDTIPLRQPKSSSDEHWVRLDGSPQKARPDEIPFYDPLVNDLIEDFNSFISQLNDAANAEWNIPNLNADITNGIKDSHAVFCADPCWFRISHSANGCVLNFAKTFFRKGDIPGIVFGYYHAWKDYADAWGDQDPRSQALAQAKNGLLTDVRVNELIENLTDLIDTSGLSESTQQQPKKLDHANGSNDTTGTSNIEWTASLEVSLRVPIRKPSDGEVASFENQLQEVRERLKQKSVGVFDETNMKMHYLGENGWSNGCSKFVRVSMGPQTLRHEHSQFLTRVKNAIHESSAITKRQSPSVFTNRNNGSIIPAIHAYFYNLLTQPHLGFSFFPIAKETQMPLSDLCLLDNGRWLWDSVFPYAMGGVDRATSTSELFPPLVLLDVKDNQCAVYAPYAPGAGCLCGRHYPETCDRQSGSTRLGELRCDCPGNHQVQIDAGNPQAVLHARFGNLQDAGDVWEGFLSRIS